MLVHAGVRHAPAPLPNKLCPVRAQSEATPAVSLFEAWQAMGDFCSFVNLRLFHALLPHPVHVASGVRHIPSPFRELHVSWCFMMFHDVSCCFMMFQGLAKHSECCEEPCCGRWCFFVLKRSDQRSAFWHYTKARVLFHSVSRSANNTKSQSRAFLTMPKTISTTLHRAVWLRLFRD